MYLYLTRLMDFNCVKPRDRVNFLHKRKKTSALGLKISILGTLRK